MSYEIIEIDTETAVVEFEGDTYDFSFVRYFRGLGTEGLHEQYEVYKKPAEDNTRIFQGHVNVLNAGKNGLKRAINDFFNPQED